MFYNWTLSSQIELESAENPYKIIQLTAGTISYQQMLSLQLNKMHVYLRSLLEKAAYADLVVWF